MPRMKNLAGGVILGLCLAVTARADEAADARALVERAVKAHGGGDRLDRDRASVQKAKGKYLGMGEAIPFTITVSFQRPDRLRVEMDLDFKGQNISVLQIIDHDKGWFSLNGEVQEMPKVAIEIAHEQIQVREAVRLTPLLRDKAFKLSPLGEVRVGDRPAVGVHVERQGRRDVNLFFDKETGLLIKSESRARDVMNPDQEFTSEEVFEDFRKIDGALVPHKVTIKRDGKVFLESELTEIKGFDRLDDALFAKP
jgi:hypothetical protein